MEFFCKSWVLEAEQKKRKKLGEEKTDLKWREEEKRVNEKGREVKEKGRWLQARDGMSFSPFFILCENFVCKNGKEPFFSPFSSLLFVRILMKEMGVTCSYLGPSLPPILFFLSPSSYSCRLARNHVTLYSLANLFLLSNLFLFP